MTASTKELTESCTPLRLAASQPGVQHSARCESWTEATRSRWHERSSCGMITVPESRPSGSSGAESTACTCTLATSRAALTCGGRRRETCASRSWPVAMQRKAPFLRVTRWTSRPRRTPSREQKRGDASCSTCQSSSATALASGPRARVLRPVAKVALCTVWRMAEAGKGMLQMLAQTRTVPTGAVTRLARTRTLSCAALLPEAAERPSHSGISSALGHAALP
mmetsp:Transcript_16062/g.51252  ORF Transcript_16062/g.51252 Transcript_16062/m.51252 type:complete len:223 (+) Transcript_16062:141-809(+)